MPEQDDYTLLSKVTEVEAKRGWRIPAMALTAYVRPEDYIHTLSTGFQKHISKPVDTTELIRALAKLAGGTRSFDIADRIEHDIPASISALGVKRTIVQKVMLGS